MQLSKALSRASLAVGLAAFGLTGALSLRAQVEPFFAVLRSIGAFAGVLCLARWSAAALDYLDIPGGPPPSAADFPGGPTPDPRQAPRSDTKL